MNANVSSVTAIISKWAFKKNQLLMCCRDFLGEILVSVSLTEVGKVLGPNVSWNLIHPEVQKCNCSNLSLKM